MSPRQGKKWAWHCLKLVFLPIHYFVMMSCSHQFTQSVKDALFIYLKRFQHNGGGAAAEGLRLDEARWPVCQRSSQNKRRRDDEHEHQADSVETIPYSSNLERARCLRTAQRHRHDHKQGVKGGRTVGAAAKMHAKWKQQHESYGTQINEKYIQRGAAATQAGHRDLLKAR